MSTHKKKDRKRKEAAFLFCKVFLRVAEGKEKTFFNSSRRAMLYKNCARMSESRYHSNNDYRRRHDVVMSEKW